MLKCSMYPSEDHIPSSSNSTLNNYLHICLRILARAHLTVLISKLPSSLSKLLTAGQTQPSQERIEGQDLNGTEHVPYDKNP